MAWVWSGEEGGAGGLNRDLSGCFVDCNCMLASGRDSEAYGSAANARDDDFDKEEGEKARKKAKLR